MIEEVHCLQELWVVHQDHTQHCSQQTREMSQISERKMLAVVVVAGDMNWECWEHCGDTRLDHSSKDWSAAGVHDDCSVLTTQLIFGSVVDWSEEHRRTGFSVWTLCCVAAGLGDQ